ncbi:FMN-binding protein [Variovorax sp. HW608]|uniref:FMN-binding protein n=1 Tax=Variovorax sp. HW608 TaxID=1034889 RepID=UPI000B5AD11E|nr:FMN-binding protein [Variovorax sp. HW608]
MISRRETLRRMAGSGVAAAALWQTRAFAATFMDIEEARKILLPRATSFEPVALDLGAPRIAELAAGTHTQPPRGYAPMAWAGLAEDRRVGWVLSDRAIGKYELIDFAAGFEADGSVSGLEILAYRESHGAEIRTPGWRRQFVGRKGPDQLRFNEDIRNISGATLSCQHVTEAVQRLSLIVQQLAQKPARS